MCRTLPSSKFPCCEEALKYSRRIKYFCIPFYKFRLSEWQLALPIIKWRFSQKISRLLCELCIPKEWNQTVTIIITGCILRFQKYSYHFPPHGRLFWFRPSHPFRISTYASSVFMSDLLVSRRFSIFNWKSIIIWDVFSLSENPFDVSPLSSC